MLRRETLINILIKLNSCNISFVPLDIWGYLIEVQMKGLSLPQTFLCERIFDRDMHTYVVSKKRVMDSSIIMQLNIYLCIWSIMFFRINISSCKYCDVVILKGSWKCTFEQFYAFCMHTQFGNRLGKSWFCGSNGNERNEFRMRKWIKDFPIIAYCPVYYTIYLILPQAELYLYA